MSTPTQTVEYGPMLPPIERAIINARAMGRAAGIAAASWATDGNTSSDHARRVLAMLNDGDPAGDAYLPAYPNLSGEWADDATRDSVALDVCSAIDLLPVCPTCGGSAIVIGARGYESCPDDDCREPTIDDIPPDVVDRIAQAWEDGIAETFQPECERLFIIAAGDDS